MFSASAMVNTRRVDGQGTINLTSVHSLAGQSRPKSQRRNNWNSLETFTWKRCLGQILTPFYCPVTIYMYPLRLYMYSIWDLFHCFGGERVSFMARYVPSILSLLCYCCCCPSSSTNNSGQSDVLLPGACPVPPSTEHRNDYLRKTEGVSEWKL